MVRSWRMAKGAEHRFGWGDRQLRYSLIHATPRPLIPDQVRNDEGVGLTTRASGGTLARDAGDFRCAEE